MKITYDPYADAMYLYFNDKDIKGTSTLDKDIIMDYTDKKMPVGIELLDISKKMAKKALGSLQFELTTETPKPILSK